MAVAELVRDNSVSYFEGVEKLLEIWFAASANQSGAINGDADLRKIPRAKLESMLKIVRCEIISFMNNDQIDAYVLSESSMFISRRRFILKTCGTTTPLLCIQVLLMLAEKYGGFTHIEDLFYSRKNYKRPDLQLTPHQHFDQEVNLLDKYFPNGAAYCLGAMNRDCWYLYTLNSSSLPVNRLNNCRMLAGKNNNMKHNTTGVNSIDLIMNVIRNNDPEQNSSTEQTLEILMTDLDPHIMSIFTREESQNAAQATKRSGIDKLVPNMCIDDFLFNPCGYSMNGVMRNGYYMTIHITPEPEYSYVSFETNLPCNSYGTLIAKVLDTFQPGKFTVTIFASEDAPVQYTLRDMQQMTTIGQWNRRDIQQCHFKNYDLVYSFYAKFPS